MINLVLKRLLNRKKVSVIFILAILCLFTFVPLGILYSRESLLTVKDSIQKYGRGSYDILVRPNGSKTSVEKKIGIVEDNYIGDSKGGITLSEWNEIKSNKAIDVAAPVASLGYFSGVRRSLELPTFSSPVRFSWQFYTTDGLKKYKIGDEHQIHMFDGKDRQNVEYIYYPRDLNDSFGGTMNILLPQTYYLLTAIDVASEEKLTGIDYKSLNRELTKEEAIFVNQQRQTYGNFPVVKILQRKDFNIPLGLSLNVESINVSLSDFKRKFGIAPDERLISVIPEENKNFEKTMDELTKVKGSSIKNYDINLSNYQKPFKGSSLSLDRNFKLHEIDGGMTKNDSAAFYVASKIDYRINGNSLKVKKVKTDEPPSYKLIQKRGQAIDDADKLPFNLIQTGTFLPKDMDNQITSSPLGIYSSTDTKTTDGKVITPTVIPGSFIATPAIGVTTLEGAEIIKGKKPIDAIRIRVAGIHSYNKEAQEKIEQIATSLHKKGYEVDIVAGASFKTQKLFVDGIGEVLEPWTTLGVAQSLLSSWNMISLLTTILFTLFGFVWLFSRIVFERNQLLFENELLITIGWNRRKIIKRNVLEQLILTTSAYLISLIILICLKQPIVILFIPSFLWAISSVIIFLLFNQKKRRKAHIKGYKMFSSIIFYKKLIIPVMIVLLVSSLIMTIQMSSIGSGLIEANSTTLGKFTVSKTMYFQFFILLATIFLSLVSVNECINSILTERKQEFYIYHTIGWSKKRTLMHFSKEVSIWAGTSILIGLIIGIVALTYLRISHVLIALGSIFTFLLIAVSLIIITTKKRYI
ncbi:hypothetical protein ACFCYN_20570 [Gottfriedia sp. NPDC056225]|uniref:hypothetical protein n=1 Tax=Gottfriedia sp. NPDC056225 TaxID=3345751 RepID=UPI0035D8303D